MPRRPPPWMVDTGRVEAFSDGVFAIALTLLVLDLPRPAAGRFAETLLSDWPTYVAYLFAFFTIGSIWLSHHNAFTRIRRADPVILVLNLVLLLGASLVPWPTALVSAAVGEESHADQVAAILACALVMLVLSVPWSLLSRHLVRQPGLLGSDADRGWMRRNMWQSAGVGAVALGGAAVAFVAPLVSLVLFVVVPASFLVVNACATGVATPGEAPEEGPGRRQSS